MTGNEIVKCPNCDEDPYPLIDICEKCEEEFGDCDGTCGDTKCGNQHCQHCDYDIYYQSCKNCGISMPIEMWNK